MRKFYFLIMMFCCIPAFATESLIMDIKSDNQFVSIQIINSSNATREIPANLTATRDRGPLVFVVEGVGAKKLICVVPWMTLVHH